MGVEEEVAVLAGSEEREGEVVEATRGVVDEEEVEGAEAVANEEISIVVSHEQLSLLIFDSVRANMDRWSLHCRFTYSFCKYN